MKSGIDYFSLDVSLDDKFELIEAEFGLTGFAVVVKLFQKIYGTCGYYCEYTNEVALLFAKRIGMGGSVVSEIVTASIRRGIFDKDLFDKYQILTSRGIQKRYFEAVSRRSKIIVKNSYLLVNVTQFIKNADILNENVDNYSKNDNILKQSKVKKSKVDKSKENSERPDYSAVQDCFEQNIGVMTPSIGDDVVYYIKNGFEDMLIVECIKKAAGANKASWNYVKGIIKNLQADGIKTKTAFLATQNNSKKSTKSAKSTPEQADYEIKKGENIW